MQSPHRCVQGYVGPSLRHQISRTSKPPLFSACCCSLLRGCVGLDGGLWGLDAIDANPTDGKYTYGTATGKCAQSFEL
eukprot:4282803-Pleurochrysis_carterae.AAC.1